MKHGQSQTYIQLQIKCRGLISMAAINSKYAGQIMAREISGRKQVFQLMMLAFLDTREFILMVQVIIGEDQSLEIIPQVRKRLLFQMAPLIIQIGFTQLVQLSPGELLPQDFLHLMPLTPPVQGPLKQSFLFVLLKTMPHAKKYLI